MKHRKKGHTQNKIDLIHTCEKEYTNVFLFSYVKQNISITKKPENTGGSLRASKKLNFHS